MSLSTKSSGSAYPDTNALDDNATSSSTFTSGASTAPVATGPSSNAVSAPKSKITVPVKQKIRQLIYIILENGGIPDFNDDKWAMVQKDLDEKPAHLKSPEDRNKPPVNAKEIWEKLLEDFTAENPTYQEEVEDIPAHRQAAITAAVAKMEKRQIETEDVQMQDGGLSNNGPGVEDSKKVKKAARRERK